MTHKADRVTTRSWRCALGIATLGCLLWGCGKSEANTQRAYHILMISLGAFEDADLDSLDPKRHPNLTQWLRQSTRYSHLQPEASDGLTTTASFMSGLTAEEHGARMRVDQEAEGSKTSGTPVSAEHSLLAEYLIDHSFNPGAVVGAEAFHDPQYGINQGFREYEWISASASAIAPLASDWIDHHYKQPFFCYTALSANPELEWSAALEELDAALGQVLSSMGQHKLLDAALIIVTATRTRGQSPYLPLMVKAPRQRTAHSDLRPLRPYHMPQLILQHTTLPVAAVRPIVYLKHPLPPESGSDANPPAQPESVHSNHSTSDE